MESFRKFQRFETILYNAKFKKWLIGENRVSFDSICCTDLKKTNFIILSKPFRSLCSKYE